MSGSPPPFCAIERIAPGEPAAQLTADPQQHQQAAEPAPAAALRARLRGNVPTQRDQNQDFEHGLRLSRTVRVELQPMILRYSFSYASALRSQLQSWAIAVSTICRKSA